MTDTVTGLRELPGYPPLTGARRDWPWKAGIQTGAHPPGAFQDYAPYTHAPQKSRKPGPAGDGCYRSATWTRLEPPWP